jgi:mannose-1-phosphate guanylyltransferase
MKAFILAAGKGTRLRPLTDSTPKCLLPIRGTPLLEIWLEKCGASGITEVLVNAHAHAGKVQDFVRRQNTGVTVHIAEERELLGSAGTLAENRSFVQGEEAFFILYGDVLTNMDLPELLEFHREKKAAATLVIHQVDDPTRCGVVITDENDTVTGFIEKPVRPESNWAFSGVLVATPEILDLIPEQRPADIGFDVLPKLIGKMAARRTEGFVLDIGTLSSYTAAQSSWPGWTQTKAETTFQSRKP